MATPRYARTEIWSTPQAASGTRLAMIPDVLALEDTKAVSGDSHVTLRLPVGSPAFAQLQARRPVRVVFSDDSFDEWPIQKITTRYEQNGALTATVEGGDPRLVLADVLVYRIETDGTHIHQFSPESRTAAQHLSEFILPSLAAEGYTWVAAGTIDPTKLITMVYDYTTALQAIQFLAQDAGVEFQFRRDGTTQYLVDLLTRIGASAATRYVRQGRDLLGLMRTLDAAPMATRVVPRGADQGGVRATMAEARWKVTAITASTDATLADPLGGAAPILVDDQLNGYYLEKLNGSRVQITDSVQSTQKVSISDTTNLTVNDLVAIRKTSGGEVLDYLEHPLYRAAPPSGYGLVTKVLDRPDIPGTINLIDNPAMRVYTTGSNAPPDGWAVIPGSGLAVTNVDKETGAGKWRGGGASAKLSLMFDGEGIETGYAAITPTAARPFFSGFMGFWNSTDTGAPMRVRLVAGKATVSVSSGSRATAGGVTTVTVNTGSAHGLAAGGQAELLGITGGTVADGYNGIHTVSRVVDSDTYEFQLTSDPGTFTPSSATNRHVLVFTASSPPTFNTWQDLGWQNIDNPTLLAFGAVVVKVQLMKDGSIGGANEVWVDRAQVTQGVGEGQRDFIEGNGATLLWQAANLYLRDNAPPATRYEIPLIDLARLDGGRWANEDLALGQTIVAVAPDVPGSPVSTRVLDITRNLLQDGVASVGLSTKPSDITDALSRRTAPPRIRPDPPPRRRRVLPVRLQGPNFVPAFGDTAFATDGTGVTTNSGASIELYANISGDFRFQGAVVVGFNAKITKVSGTITGFEVQLHKDGSSIATTAFQSVAGEYGRAPLSESVASAKYIIYVDLEPSASGVLRLDWVDVYIEIDELVGGTV